MGWEGSRSHCYSMVDPLSFSSTQSSPYNPHKALRQALKEERHDLMLDHDNEQFIFSFLYLVMILFLNRIWDLYLLICISDISPLSCYDFLAWTEPEI